MNLTNSPLYSEDLAPVESTKRTWNTWNYAALWISMSLCIPTYMIASSLIQGGMNWWQAIITIFLGNAIVLIDDKLIPARRKILAKIFSLGMECGSLTSMDQSLLFRMKHGHL